ncbi:hypothetical protein DXT99_04345 [Pontibacter diazotrophicus]|uniref:Glycosyl transferase family 2 n=1 Tax=Pontibacter diazotrophicus TaxID=1400979 RepID=A0A3D8LGB5_9BACT|nr:rhamnan synthesis F family protein [Pontibacter diazotrophicus]RDV16437.1 hypothetical protein DXT99_04345 [Pontibacter diazotrophicus]
MNRENIQAYKIAVFYHIFYEDSVDLIVDELTVLKQYSVVFFFNISDETPEKAAVKSKLLAAFPDSFILYSSNKGKDIGAKLLLLALYRQLQYKCEYFIFLHDKKSLHALNSKNWRNGLMKIIHEENIELIIDKFRRNQNIGIVATKEYIISESRTEGGWAGLNGPILDRLTTKYEISPPHLKYVAGTIFWSRAKVLEEFFTNNNPLDIRCELENGNVLDNFTGTYTHSWERLLSWIVTSKGLTIDGI